MPDLSLASLLFRLLFCYNGGMKTSNLYPIADIRHLPEPRQHRSMRGLLTGEYREPLKGEWFLSGAIPECYYMRQHHCSMKFHICKLVQVRERKIIEIVGE